MCQWELHQTWEVLSEMTTNQVDNISWIAIWVLLATLLAVGVADIYLVRYGHGGPTVSSTIWALAKEYPIIVLIVGILLGHLFWPQH